MNQQVTWFQYHLPSISRKLQPQFKPQLRVFPSPITREKNQFLQVHNPLNLKFTRLLMNKNNQLKRSHHQDHLRDKPWSMWQVENFLSYPILSSNPRPLHPHWPIRIKLHHLLTIKPRRIQSIQRMRNWEFYWSRLIVTVRCPVLTWRWPPMVNIFCYLKHRQRRMFSKINRQRSKHGFRELKWS